MKIMKINDVKSICRVTALLAVVVVATVAASTLTAQEPESAAPPSDLPTGKQVMDRYIEACGGEEAFGAIKNRYSESTLEFVGQGIKLEIKTWATRPNLIYILMESDITGKVEKGCNGEVFWESSLMSGPVVHEGVQHVMGVRDSTFERFVNWSDIYETAECVGMTEVGDHNCYEVVLTPKEIEGMEEEGAYHPVHLFVDDTDWLIRKMNSAIEIPAGTIDVEALAGDYQEVDGVLLAHRLQMNMLGQQRLVTTEKTEHNIDMPEDRFALPEDVQKLVDK